MCFLLLLFVLSAKDVCFSTEKLRDKKKAPHLCSGFVIHSIATQNRRRKLRSHHTPCSLRIKLHPSTFQPGGDRCDVTKNRPECLEPKKKNVTSGFWCDCLLDAASVYSARDLFERGHAVGEKVVGHQSRDAHHSCAPVVQLLGLK